MSQDNEALDSALRKVLQNAPATVLLVTARHGSDVNGLTVTSFCSVSMDPPSILVCVNRDSRTHKLISESRRFCASFLSREQEQAAMSFASSGTAEEKIDGCGALLGEMDGLPSIEASIACLACDVTQSIESGSHTIFVGEVKQVSVRGEGAPLLYGMQGFGSFTH